MATVRPARQDPRRVAPANTDFARRSGVHAQRAEIVMRVSTIVLLAGLAWASMTPAQAAGNSPFCANYETASGSHEGCNFLSFQDCLEFIRGMGGYCSGNPSAAAPPPPQARRPPAAASRARPRP
jgi:hypothetical protein